MRERDLVHPLSGDAAPARPLLPLRALQLDGRRPDDRLRLVARLALDGVAAGDLALRWGVPQCGLFRQLGSTLDALHDLGAQGAVAGTAVIAEEQTAGRGRDGRTWHSPAGGVWLGVLLRPGRVELGVMSVRVGLAVADAVDALLGRPEARLKWPNDVLLAERKLAGILCEGRWQGEALQWLAVGVGVNVCNSIPGAVARRAVALAEWLPAVRRIDLLDRLVPALVRLTQAAGAAALSERECAAFAARDWLLGRQLRAPAAGRARGLRPDGALLVDLGAATIAVREGHVELA
ncbi:MAG: biotin--[acetyl-CoA-carboxylase] ligase [Gemmatimonadetes bacterium]|nr:MAG: biotin--[acetyl-CoA-carboxylase] ligase [Gemmatimonadota bacterium]